MKTAVSSIPAPPAPLPDTLLRFAVLLGAACPRCGLPMVLAGSPARPRLMCQQSFGYNSRCCYSYSNVESAEDELRPH